jgi:acetolactate synthase-1/2/3 large subunit
MGYGIPSAYAAKLARPDRQVVGVVGDGGFQMTAGELATARRLGLCVPIIVLNDGWLGLMKIKQERQGNPESASVLGEPMEPPAHYFGVPVRAVRNQAELADAIRWGLSLDGPSVIETFVDVEPYSKTVFD